MVTNSRERSSINEYLNNVADQIGSHINEILENHLNQRRQSWEYGSFGPDLTGIFILGPYTLATKTLQGLASLSASITGGRNSKR